MVSMSSGSAWAAEQFGEDAHDVEVNVVKGLFRGQRAARAVKQFALAEGASDNYAYGSMWNARYQIFVEQCELAGLPGFESVKPKGAPYRLAVVNGRVLIPFRHSDTVGKPIGEAKISSLIPRRVSRENGVLPEQSLFDAVSEAGADDVASISVEDAAVAAHVAGYTVVYVAYVANADSDEIPEAWWGTPVSLNDDGSMTWSPVKLDLALATDDVHVTAGGGLPGTAAGALPGFAQGAEPPLAFGSKVRKDDMPVSEVETRLLDSPAENDE